jgi:hypothetical protein
LWVTPVIPALQRMRQKDCYFQLSLSYIVRPCLKKQNKTKQQQHSKSRSIFFLAAILPLEYQKLFKNPLIINKCGTKQITEQISNNQGIIFTLHGIFHSMLIFPNVFHTFLRCLAATPLYMLHFESRMIFPANEKSNLNNCFYLNKKASLSSVYLFLIFPGRHDTHGVTITLSVACNILT